MDDLKKEIHKINISIYTEYISVIYKFIVCHIILLIIFLVVFLLSFAIVPLQVNANDPKTFDQTRIAAEQGDADAQCDLGFMYLTGEGVAKDKIEAARWYRMAAEQGHAQAQYNLGDMYQHAIGGVDGADLEEAEKWHRLAAAQGLADAQFAIGAIYDHPVKGKTGDMAEAARWYRMAAEQGHPKAQCSLASMYHSGEGVPKDEAESARWYRLLAGQITARQNDAHFSYCLGVSPYLEKRGEGSQEMRDFFKELLK